MLILIEKDSATKIAKEVANDDEAQGYVEQGFHVLRVTEDGNVPFVHASTDEPAAKKTAAKKTKG